jgi:hypothetical protein
MAAMRMSSSFLLDASRPGTPSESAAKEALLLAGSPEKAIKNGSTSIHGVN